MNYKKFVPVVLFLLLMPITCMGSVDYSSLFSSGDTAPSEFVHFQVAQLKYDPYPAEPGEYMTLWIEIHNPSTTTAKGVTFEVLPEYPFSIDPNENAKREYAAIPGLYTMVLQYKIRVDKDAVEGMNEISLRYKFHGGDWIKKDMEIQVTEPPDKAELRAFYVETEPKPYPGSETTLSIDLANIASGSAYYTIVEASTEAAEIEVDEIFIGTMDADDFDTINFDMKIKDYTEPGTYPVKIKAYYKDEDDREYEKEEEIDFRVYSKEELAMEMQSGTDPIMTAGTYVGIVILGLIVLTVILFILKYIIKWFLLPFFKSLKQSFPKGKKR